MSFYYSRPIPASVADSSSSRLFQILLTRAFCVFGRRSAWFPLNKKINWPYTAVKDENLDMKNGPDAKKKIFLTLEKGCWLVGTDWNYFPL